MYADINHLLHKRLPYCQFVSRFMVIFLTDFYKGVKKCIWCLSVMKTGINFDIALLWTEFMNVCGNSYAFPMATGAKSAESWTWLFTFFWCLVCAECKVVFTLRCWAWYLIAWAVLFFTLQWNESLFFRYIKWEFSMTNGGPQ